MLKKINSMITTEYMDDETFAFGLDTGSFQSLFDQPVDTNNNFKDKVFDDLASSDDGLLSDLGFPDEGWY